MRATLQQCQLARSQQPSHWALPTASRPPSRQSALNARALTGVPLPFSARPLALDSRAAAHVPLGASQQAHQLAPTPCDATYVPLGATAVTPAGLFSTRLRCTRVACVARVVCVPRLDRVACVVRVACAACASFTSAESLQPGLLFGPLTLHLFPSWQTARLHSPNLQYTVQYSQSAPVRIASTVLVPAVPQPGPPSAIHALASLAAAQPAATPPSALFPFEAAAVQPVAQVGAIDFTRAHLIRKVEAHFAVCAHPVSQAGALRSECAQSY